MPALAGKTIVIMGGTTGLGLSAAHALSKEGAQLVLVGRKPESIEEAIEQIGEDLAHGIQGDATHPQTAIDAIDCAVGEFGGFDGLYHVAGGSGRRMGDGPLHEITDEGWDYTIDLNLTSVFYSNRAAIRKLLELDHPGSILNMGSVLGYSPSPRYFSTHTYATTKAAIIGLTRTSAAHYAEENIRCNVIAPALVETPMSERAQSDPDIMNFIKTKQPLDGGRIGLPDDLDAAAVFLLSDQSKFVTGQVLSVDGGWSVSEGQY